MYQKRNFVNILNDVLKNINLRTILVHGGSKLINFSEL